MVRGYAQCSQQGVVRHRIWQKRLIPRISNKNDNTKNT